MRRSKLRVSFLASALALTILVPTFAQASIIDYGSTVSIAAFQKFGFAWTQTNGTNARAKIVIGGDLSDKNRNGYVQTDQIESWYSKTAYIGHGEGGQITIAYTK